MLTRAEVSTVLRFLSRYLLSHFWFNGLHTSCFSLSSYYCPVILPCPSFDVTFWFLENPKFYNAKPARLRLATIKGQSTSLISHARTRAEAPKWVLYSDFCHVIIWVIFGLLDFTHLSLVYLHTMVQSFYHVHLLMKLFWFLENPKFYNAKPTRLRLATIKG